jgi:hypothetical protein
MKITLELVRQTLRETLGHDSFVAGFITSVQADSGCSTAGITKEGQLSYNPSFIDEFVTTKEDLFSLVFHELLHPMFNHFIYHCGELENIAADAIINTVISTLYADQSKNGHLFRKIYKPKGVTGLLRSGSRMEQSRLDKVYDRLYFRSEDNRKLSTGELITTLKILLDHQAVSEVRLVGTHGTSEAPAESFPQETLERIAYDIKRSATRTNSRSAGYSSCVIDLLMEALHTHLSIKRVILERFATNRKVDKFRELFRNRHICSSPVPIYPSKRDLILLAAGFYPGSFHNAITRTGFRQKGLAIYLDVSGSVNEYLPKILAILQSLKREITTIYLFSNQVYETSFTSLLKGRIKTTGGTDFDCICASILENRLDKAVIITDGQADMKAENQKKLRDIGLITLTILFDRAQTCRPFEEFGDIVPLADITR